jgi:hypothetical protein
VGQPSKDPCTIAAIFLVAHTATMFHAAIHRSCFRDDLVAWSAFYVADKTNTTAVFFVGWVV